VRRIFGPKMVEVEGGQRRLHNEEFHHLYASQNIIRVIKSGKKSWEGQVARMCEMRNASNILVGKPEGKRPFGKPRSRWDVILE
jgi:hypothetical protein